MKINQESEEKEPKKVKVYKIKESNIEKMIAYLKRNENGK